MLDCSFQLARCSRPAGLLKCLVLHTRCVLWEVMLSGLYTWIQTSVLAGYNPDMTCVHEGMQDQVAVALELGVPDLPSA